MTSKAFPHKFPKITATIDSSGIIPVTLKPDKQGFGVFICPNITNYILQEI